MDFVIFQGTRVDDAIFQGTRVDDAIVQKLVVCWR